MITISYEKVKKCNVESRVHIATKKLRNTKCDMKCEKIKIVFSRPRRSEMSKSYGLHGDPAEYECGIQIAWMLKIWIGRTRNIKQCSDSVAVRRAEH